MEFGNHVNGSDARFARCENAETVESAASECRAVRKENKEMIDLPYSGVFHGCDPVVLKPLISRLIATWFVYS